MSNYYIDTVDKEDKIIGQELKSKKQELGYISRVVAIFIKDSDGKFIICKRKSNKDILPGKWDISAVGKVRAGESYEEAAKRELLEELNFSCELKFIDKFYQEFPDGDNYLKLFVGIFVGTTDDKPQLNEELVKYKKLSIEELQMEIDNQPEKFSQGLINDLTHIKNKL